MGKAEQQSWQGYALLIAATLVTIGFILGHYNNQGMRSDQQGLLQAAGKEIGDSFKAELRHAIDIVESTTWLFYASRNVDREEFENFAANALRAAPNVKELRWSPRVPDEQREAFVNQASEQGLKDFDLKEKSPKSADLFRSGRREVYFPLFYIYPKSDDRLGLDVYSRTEDRWAMHAAADQEKPVATAVNDVPPYGNRMLIYVPVFDRKQASPAGQGTSNLVGYVTAVVTLDSLVSAMRQKIEPMGIDVLLFDNTNKAHQLLAYLPSKGSDLNAEEAAIKYRIAKSGFVLPLNVAGRDWEFVMHPNQPVLENDSIYLSALAIGVLLIAVLAIRAIRRRPNSIADSAGI